MITMRSRSAAAFLLIVVFSCILVVTSGNAWWFRKNNLPNLQPTASPGHQLIEAGEGLISVDDHDDDDHDVVMNTLKDLNVQIKGNVILLPSPDIVKDLTWSKPTPVPLAIVQPANEDDVRKVVPILAHLKRKHQIEFCIKSGGHHYNAYSSIHRGIVLDLARLNSYKLLRNHSDTTTTKNPTAVIGPAVTGSTIWNELVRKRGVGCLMGGCPAVNQGGFILGGGFSYWSRLYGLGCDRLRQARVVLADGSVVVANSMNEYQDLFWALRGAGSAGVGGVVTAFELDLFRTQDQQVYGIGLISTVEETAHFMSKMNDATFPGNAGMSLFLFPEKYYGEDFVCVYNWYDTGIDKLQAGIKTLNSTFHEMLSEETANRFGLEMKSATDHSKNGLMDGRLWRVWNGFLMPEQCTPSNILKLLSLLKKMRDLGEGCVTVEILLWGGAISKIDPKDTAFYWRNGRFNICVNLGVPTHVADASEIFERQQAILEKAWQKVERRYLKGCYYNYPERDASLGDYFGGNVRRLRSIKKKYDPEAIFSHPQSF